MTDTAHVVSGRKLRDKLLVQAAEVSASLRGRNLPPRLAVVLVGENPASLVYVQSKMKAAESCGIDSTLLTLPAQTDQATLNTTIEQLNTDPSVNGILLQLPLPSHLDRDTALDAISPAKDVDGLTPTNVGLLELKRDGLKPCTPLGIMRILESIGTKLKGIDAVMIGRSDLVGRPMASLLAQEEATVTMCHRYTKDIGLYLKSADLVIVAAGSPELVKGKQLKPGATVIDVGITPVTDDEGKRRILGDCAFDSCKDVAAYITPVPGGVGPMTVASLMTNTLDATCRQHGLPLPEWKIR
ncbi:MAG: bifunctional methylenetetrahydrofolate dehydrogenase/methenyltetrahydrofolate cyclohydrolase [Proteobacteria bacterium]|nr:bifunctional methylenetetrahydrofolate dehydrogenase/methenyltetrahydrofolate cyclohydrolase [Pseudomonadota bacterium]